MKSLVCALLILISSTIQATDFYVSTSGTSSNNGTSQSTPWNFTAMLSKINSGAIKAGDRILFRKGDVFNSSATIGFGGAANSGTATQPVYFGSYGTGAKPRFEANTPYGIFYVVGKNYWTWDGLNFQDLTFPASDKLNIAPMGTGIRIGDFGGTTKSNYCVIKNCDFDNIGLGVVILGDYNLVDSCTFTNLKNVKNTPNTGGSTAYEDYGANGITLEGSNNQFLHSYYKSNWCESYDFGYSGGANEMYGACVNNTFAYNTYIDCGGIAEFGSSNGAVSTGNTFAYNKIIQCGSLSWINFNSVFATQATNTKYYNNIIVETSESRFSGPNTGAGILKAESLSHLSQDLSCLAFSAGSPNVTVFDLRNNIFYLANSGFRVVQNATVASKTIHQNNVFKFLNGAGANMTLNANEVTTTASIWTTETGSPQAWTYQLVSGSAATDRGQNLGFTYDFEGNIVPSVPNAGILETSGGTGGGSTLAVSASTGTITCNGGTTTVTVSASGGTSPYSGTGTFSVGAGTYTYSVTDAAGATKNISVTVSQPAAVSVALSAGAITVTGGTTTLSVTATGGSGSGYTYSVNGGAYQSANTFTSMGAGTHTVTVKDGKGCTGTKSVTLTVGSSNPLVVSTVAGTITCNGGTTSVTISATGGTAPYSGTATYTVSAGTYTYVVTDAAGTSQTTSITISQPSALTLTVSAGTISATGGTTSITATSTGGAGSNTYKLNSGVYQSSNIFSGVGEGTHTVTVKDKNGCTRSAVVTVSATSTGGGALTLTLLSVTNITCQGKRNGKIYTQATGGTPPYLFKTQWIAYQPDSWFTNCYPGTFNITVKDATGATKTISATVQNSTVVCGTSGRDGSGTPETTVVATESIAPPANPEMTVLAFPNPSSSQFSLEVKNAPASKDILVEVMDLNGRKVYQAKGAPGKKYVFGESFISGTYFVRVSQDSLVITQKLIKAR
jgi:hypothetical protein